MDSIVNIWHTKIGDLIDKNYVVKRLLYIMLIYYLN